jgi:hypothetical protein
MPASHQHRALRGREKEEPSTMNLTENIVRLSELALLYDINFIEPYQCFAK